MAGELFTALADKFTPMCAGFGHGNTPRAIAEEFARAALAAVREVEGTAARDVIAERRRQVDVEGWTPEHDDQHRRGEMAAAAAAYALHDLQGGWFGRWRDVMWPWDKQWWKPTTRRRDLVKAGALILAEIERLDRAALLAKDGE